MASINGWIFILVGAVVAGVSFFMYDEMWAFIYVGAAFILYGIIKALINKSKTLPVQMPTYQTNGQYKPHLSQPPQSIHHQANHQVHPQMHNPSQHAGRYVQHNQAYNMNNEPIICRACGNRLRLHDNFCSFCGRRHS